MGGGDRESGRGGGLDAVDSSLYGGQMAPHRAQQVKQFWKTWKEEIQKVGDPNETTSSWATSHLLLPVLRGGAGKEKVSGGEERV